MLNLGLIDFQLLPSAKTEDSPHSHSHNHETVVTNDAVVRLVSRPRVVQQLNTGPFVVSDPGSGQFIIDDTIDASLVEAPFRSLFNLYL